MKIYYINEKHSLSTWCTWCSSWFAFSFLPSNTGTPSRRGRPGKAVPLNLGCPLAYLKKGTATLASSPSSCPPFSRSPPYSGISYGNALSQVSGRVCGFNPESSHVSHSVISLPILARSACPRSHVTPPYENRSLENGTLDRL